jgi:O-antigen/teichoic acid export membrane protein
VQNPKENVNELESKAQPTTAQNAGRGFLVITLAKVWFMIGGATITFGLPIVFSFLDDDGRKLYGQYYDINNTLSIFSMVIIGSLLPGVSRFASTSGVSKELLLKMGRRIALFLGGGLLLLFIVMRGQYAQYRGHPHLSEAYLFAGCICCAYAFYAVHIGVINGEKRFKDQAFYDVVFTTLKVVLVVGAASVGFGVTGAFFGFALAAISIAALSTRSLGTKTSTGLTPNGFFTFVGWLVLYTLAFNLAFKVDALILRPSLTPLVETESAIDILMGEYGLAVSLSRLPWQGTIALTFVIFPMISEATFQKDRERTKIYIENTMRYALILICAISLPLCARPDYIFDCIPGYTVGAMTLTWMAPAYVCFSLANLHNTILMSAGRAKSALALMIGSLLLVVGTFTLEFSGVREPERLLTLAGKMSLLSFGLVSVLGALHIRRVFGRYLSLLSLGRILGIALVTVELSNLVGVESFGAKLLMLVCVPFIFIGGLYAVGELNENDWQRFSRVFLNRIGGTQK